MFACIFDVDTNAWLTALLGVGIGEYAEEWGLNITRMTVEIQRCPQSSLSRDTFFRHNILFLNAI